MDIAVFSIREGWKKIGIATHVAYKNVYTQYESINLKIPIDIMNTERTRKIKFIFQMQNTRDLSIKDINISSFSAIGQILQIHVSFSQK